MMETKIDVHSSFFRSQNPALKLFTVLIEVIVSLVVNYPVFLVLFLLNILYFVSAPRIYLVWLKMILRILPFFSSYFLLGILLNLSFEIQILFFLKMNFLLLLSVYLISTTNMNDLFPENGKYKFFRKLNYFLSTIFLFIPLMQEQFEHNSRKTRNLFELVSLTFVESFKKICDIERKYENIQSENPELTFWKFSNLYLFSLTTCSILLLSV